MTVPPRPVPVDAAIANGFSDNGNRNPSFRRPNWREISSAVFKYSAGSIANAEGEREDVVKIVLRSPKNNRLDPIKYHLETSVFEL